MPEINIPEGFKGTPEELKVFVEKELDKYHNKEYKTDTELAEIKAKAGVKSDELSSDALERMAADKDEIVKKADHLIELMEEDKETKGGISTDPPDDEKHVEKLHVGTLVKQMQDALRFGDMSPALQEMKVSRDDLSKNGVPLPKHLADVFDGGSRIKKPDVASLLAILKTAGFLEEGQGSQGGFTVPEQFIPQVLMFDLLPPIMRSRAFTIQATTNVVKVPRIVETDRSSNIHGGVAANWTAEGTSITKSNPAFGQVALIAKKLALLTYTSSELLDDNAVGLNDFLIRVFSEALGWFEDKAFINGSGVNEPLGIRQSGAKLSTTLAGAGFLVADACDMFADSLPGTEDRLIWLMSPSLRSELPQMVSASGGDNIWYPRNILSIKDAPDPWTLLGRPIFWTEHLAKLATDEDIALIDPMNYLVMSRQDVRVSLSTDVRFETDETGYKLTSRTDGQNWTTSTLTLADGSDTVSPVVVSDHP